MGRQANAMGLSEVPPSALPVYTMPGALDAVLALDRPGMLDAADARFLSSARQAGEYAARAGAGRLLLTHLWPEADPAPYPAAARRGYDGVVGAAGIDTDAVDL